MRLLPRVLLELEASRGEDIRQDLFELREVRGDFGEAAPHLLEVSLRSELDDHAHACQRRADLVRHIGQKLTLGVTKPLHALSHLVECACQITDLVKTIGWSTHSEVS